ncbi:hypothetical protein H696_04950 [Fonticula alba]|uniref:Uncharacterized protein n=1 Tax=Fonticula alba TaxID=691883 RepID=A0A058Z2Y9_FONAL|nr:hypothetical protein H696_04950 [Fonticula alba]KCV68659.1 hypothetical protein H696_04950 [Fonticula alba]|eukprot:XP_009497091.1 hypothetical protein H696_04950 [Fonticula alba]
MDESSFLDGHLTRLAGAPGPDLPWSRTSEATLQQNDQFLLFVHPPFELEPKDIRRRRSHTAPVTPESPHLDAALAEWQAYVLRRLPGWVWLRSLTARASALLAHPWSPVRRPALAVLLPAVTPSHASGPDAQAADRAWLQQYRLPSFHVDSLFALMALRLARIRVPSDTPGASPSSANFRFMVSDRVAPEGAPSLDGLPFFSVSRSAPTQGDDEPKVLAADVQTALVDRMRLLHFLQRLDYSALPSGPAPAGQLLLQASPPPVAAPLAAPPPPAGSTAAGAPPRPGGLAELLASSATIAPDLPRRIWAAAPSREAVRQSLVEALARARAGLSLDSIRAFFGRASAAQPTSVPGLYQPPAEATPADVPGPLFSGDPAVDALLVLIHQLIRPFVLFHLYYDQPNAQLFLRFWTMQRGRPFGNGRTMLARYIASQRLEHSFRHESALRQNTFSQERFCSALRQLETLLRGDADAGIPGCSFLAGEQLGPADVYLAAHLLPILILGAAPATAHTFGPLLSRQLATYSPALPNTSVAVLLREDFPSVADLCHRVYSQVFS